MKRFCAVLLIAVLLVGLLPAGVSAMRPYAGFCGENVKWSFDADTKTMRISGSGPMYDYAPGSLPEWRDWRNIETVIIEPGITRIGSYTFYNLVNYKRVLVADTVEEIGALAFQSCRGHVIFFGSAAEIAPDAFAFSAATCGYFYGWEEEDRLSYGEQGISEWCLYTVSPWDSEKNFYCVGEQLRPEDFLLEAVSGSDSFLFAPSGAELGAYDNATPGEKRVQITSRYGVFEYAYSVTGKAELLSIAEAKLPVEYVFYNGMPWCPEPVVTVGQTVLQKDVHYTLSYENNTHAGSEAKVIVTGIGEWEGLSFVLPFRILKRNLEYFESWLYDSEFNGYYVTPNPTITATDRGMVRVNEDFVVLYENNVNKGAAKYHAVGIGSNYGVLSGDFNVVDGNDSEMHTLEGAYIGQADGELSDEVYFSEQILRPGKFNGIIQHSEQHAAYYELYRVDTDEPILVTSEETIFGGKYGTMFHYDFSNVYEDEIQTGGAVYLLAYIWVDGQNRVYAGNKVLYIPAKVPEATAMEVGQLQQTGDFRRTYLTAYGLDGVVENVTWTSSDTAVAEVANGIVTFLSPGTVTVTAAWNGAELPIEIQVNQLDISLCEVLEYDSLTGEVLLSYDQILLIPGTDYRTAVEDRQGEKYCVVTGTGLFGGELSFRMEEGKTVHTHSYNNCYEGACSICGRHRTPSHIPGEEWLPDGDTHCRYCIVCDEVQEREPHEGNGFCEKCGQKMTVLAGDINGDGKQNNKDVILMMQYFAGWDVDIGGSDPDLNGDGKQNNKDVILLMQFLAGWHIELPG